MLKNKLIVVLFTGVLIGAGAGAGSGVTLNICNRQIEAGLHTIQEQNAALERAARESADCKEKFTGVTVIYGPEQFDVTERLPRALVEAMTLAAMHSGLGAHVRILIELPDRPPHTLVAFPVRATPIAPAGNPYSVSWFNRSGRITGPVPVGQSASAGSSPGPDWAVTIPLQPEARP